MDTSGLEDWTAVRTFLAVVEARSFSAAARRLGVSQSTVSRHVASIEAVVGEALFVRSGARDRPATLTDAGASLAGPAADVRDAVMRLERRAAGHDRRLTGVVRIATVDEIAKSALAPALPQLRSRHPGLALEVIARIETASLERRDADLAVRFTLPTNADLVRKKARVIEYGVFGTKAALREGTWWVGFEHALAMIPEARWLAEKVDPTRVVFRSTSIEAQAAACAAGVGLALLPIDFAAQHPTLHAASDAIVLRRELWVVAHRDLHASARVKAVFRWAAEACAS